VGGYAPFFGCGWATSEIVGGYAPFFARFLPVFWLLNGNAPFFTAVFEPFGDDFGPYQDKFLTVFWGEMLRFIQLFLCQEIMFLLSGGLRPWIHVIGSIV
jgi:hypothetical protein